MAAESPIEDLVYPPPDLTTPQFTIRAIMTGMVLGGILSLCNVYLGLKIGWGANMSVTAALLSFGLWQGISKAFGTRTWNILENNVNQTAASSAASISSAGLVAPIPALTMLTGQELSYWALAGWVFSVALMGVIVAVGLRRQMLLVDKLPFPNGIATGETLKEMYARGKEAMARVYMLLAGAGVAAALKASVLIWGIKKGVVPGALSVAEGGTLAGKGVTSISMKNLTFAFDPSLLMVGLGALIGFRTCMWMLIGAVIAWIGLGPMALEAGAMEPGKEGAMWFGPMIKWLIWPGVALMVTASLTSFAFSWRSVVAAIRGTRKAASEHTGPDPHDVPRALFVKGAVVALVLSMVLQFLLFDIGIGLAILAGLMTFALAIVAARVSGETGITPVGPMGKVTQLTFGAIDPGSAATNLMAANVTGGAASQAADLLHDMKTGLMVGASPRFLAFAQVFGVFAGAVVGSAFYLILVPDPSNQLLTEEWAAPAVAQWKAVAELFMGGLENMPPGAAAAMAWAGGLGVVLAIGEKLVPKRLSLLAPSPTAIGIAIVIPAYYSMSMFFGGLLALILTKTIPSWSKRFIVVIAAGLVAGESLTGVVDAVIKIISAG